MIWVIVDVEGGPYAGSTQLREFGAVAYDDGPPFPRRFHGVDDSYGTMTAFEHWLESLGEPPYVFVSDNPAYDWQHVNWAFHIRLQRNPFGHSARRIGDFWAGTRGRGWRDTQSWKRLRRTPHDHHPVNDALGNAEALWRILNP